MCSAHAPRMTEAMETTAKNGDTPPGITSERERKIVYVLLQVCLLQLVVLVALQPIDVYTIHEDHHFSSLDGLTQLQDQSLGLMH